MVNTEGVSVEQKIDNPNDAPLPIKLPDGSTVFLEKTVKSATRKILKAQIGRFI
ncbi:MAG: hypothetical protein HC817_01355 [Saprospiraceae bacterium]|nr:hypothetical protein [Saprospiraceae bacterium]